MGLEFKPCYFLGGFTVGVILCALLMNQYHPSYVNFGNFGIPLDFHAAFAGHRRVDATSHFDKVTSPRENCTSRIKVIKQAKLNDYVANGDKVTVTCLVRLLGDTPGAVDLQTTSARALWGHYCTNIILYQPKLPAAVATLVNTKGHTEGTSSDGVTYSNHKVHRRGSVASNKRPDDIFKTNTDRVPAIKDVFTIVKQNVKDKFKQKRDSELDIEPWGCIIRRVFSTFPNTDWLLMTTPFTETAVVEKSVNIASALSSRLPICFSNFEGHKYRENERDFTYEASQLVGKTVLVSNRALQEFVTEDYRLALNHRCRTLTTKILFDWIVECSKKMDIPIVNMTNVQV